MHRRGRPRFLLVGGLLLTLTGMGAGPAPEVRQEGGVEARAAAKAGRVANRIHRAIRRQHLPHGTVFDPVFASSSSDQIVGYTHAGDSAIWTGHYLAAESFRYAVTGRNAARKRVRKAVRALRDLVDVTGTEMLARATAPVGSPWRGAIDGDGQPVYEGRLRGSDHVWLGNTSRDQYSGVFFGLSWAYELVDDARVQRDVRKLVPRLLEYLIANDWTVVNPDGSISTTFVHRPEQQLAFLQVGRQVDPEAFGAPYEKRRTDLADTTWLPIWLETTDPHGSYFKFNLDAINLVHLIRLEDTSSGAAAYRAAYGHLRDAVGAHGNAHFNMIDRVVAGPDEARDAETRALLEAWLERPRRDPWVDLSGEFAACDDNRACEPIPVERRPSTDFLWQRSPFTLAAGGSGTVQPAGIDLILPYWMARYYGVL